MSDEPDEPDEAVLPPSVTDDGADEVDDVEYLLRPCSSRVLGFFRGGFPVTTEEEQLRFPELVSGEERWRLASMVDWSPSMDSCTSGDLEWGASVTDEGAGEAGACI